MQRGALITRGLGCKGLLTTRGLGRCQIVVVLPGRPRQIGNARGGSGRHEDRDRPIYAHISVNASLIRVNGVQLPFPLTGTHRVDYRMDETLRIRTTLPKVQRRMKTIVIKARLVGDID